MKVSIRMQEMVKEEVAVREPLQGIKVYIEVLMVRCTSVDKPSG